MRNELDLVLQGKFELPLVSCTLRQRSTENPQEYVGPGLVTQQGGGLLVRVFAAGLGQHEALRRVFNLESQAGQLMPESHYYDLTATDLHGRTWIAQRLWVEPEYGDGTGTYLQTHPRRIESTGAQSDTIGPGRAQSFLIGSFQLPWHKYSNSDGRMTLDQFECELENFGWLVKQEEKGISVSFSIEDGKIRESFDHFLWAFSIATGKLAHAEFVIFSDRGGDHVKISDRHRSRKETRLSPPIKLFTHNATDVHNLLRCFLLNSKGSYPQPYDHAELIFRLWARVERAYQSDIEICSLVLSIAIERLIKDVYMSEIDVDEAFAEIVANDLPTIKKSELHERVQKAIQASLENAIKPRPQDVLWRLVDQGVLRKSHIQAWKVLRNSVAHGKMLDDDDRALQAHLDLFHTCLDLFYRLIFLAINYRGKFVNYSVKGLPDAFFIGPDLQEPVATVTPQK